MSILKDQREVTFASFPISQDSALKQFIYQLKTIRLFPTCAEARSVKLQLIKAIGSPSPNGFKEIFT